MISGIVFNPDEPEEGYFSSNRPGGKGGDDIYSFVIPPLLFTLGGTVTDDRTLQPVSGALVKLTGTNGKTLQYTTDDKGNYTFNKNQISPNTTFEILVLKKDYFNEKGKETTVGLEKSKELTRNFVMKPIPKKPSYYPTSSMTLTSTISSHSSRIHCRGLFPASMPMRIL